jgi:DNA-binding SARP family transcriptional activator
MIDVCLLAGVGIRRDERPVLLQPRRMLLFAYLLLEGRGRAVRRDQLVALFWPDADGERGRNALRQSIFALRAGLGADVIVASGSAELLVREAEVRCDAWALLDAVDAADHATVDRLYRDEFLAGGAYGADTPELERWLEETRARFRRLTIMAVRALADRPMLPADERRRYIERWSALEPYDETAAMRLVDVLLAAGDRSTAVVAYRAFAARLRTDLEIEPSAAFDQMVSGARVGEGVAFTASAPASPASTGPGRPSAPRGRRRVRAGGGRSRRPRSWCSSSAPSRCAAPSTRASSRSRRSPPRRARPTCSARRGRGRADARRAGGGRRRVGRARRGRRGPRPPLAPPCAGDRGVRGRRAPGRGAVAHVGDGACRRVGHAAAADGGRGRGSRLGAVGRDRPRQRRRGDAPRHDGALGQDAPPADLADGPRTVPERVRGGARGRRGGRDRPVPRRVAQRHGVRVRRHHGRDQRAGDRRVRARRQPARGARALRTGHAAPRAPAAARARALARSDVPGTLAASRAIAQLEPTAPFLLAQYGEDAYLAGRSEEALAALDAFDARTAGATPEPGHAAIRASALHSLGRFRDELRVVDATIARQPTEPHFVTARLAPLAALGARDTLALMLAAIAAREDGRDVGRLYRGAALELRVHGHAAAADWALAQGVAWLAAHPVDAASPVARQLAAAELLYDAGRTGAARAIVERLTARPRRRSRWGSSRPC